MVRKRSLSKALLLILVFGWSATYQAFFHNHGNWPAAEGTPFPGPALSSQPSFVPPSGICLACLLGRTMLGSLAVQVNSPAELKPPKKASLSQPPRCAAPLHPWTGRSPPLLHLPA